MDAETKISPVLGAGDYLPGEHALRAYVRFFPTRKHNEVHAGTSGMISPEGKTITVAVGGWANRSLQSAEILHPERSYCSGRVWLVKGCEDPWRMLWPREGLLGECLLPIPPCVLLASDGTQ